MDLVTFLAVDRIDAASTPRCILAHAAIAKVGQLGVFRALKINVSFPVPQTGPKPPTSRTAVLLEALNSTAEGGGAAYVTRTRDPIITNDVLYQLS